MSCHCRKHIGRPILHSLFSNERRRVTALQLSPRRENRLCLPRLPKESQVEIRTQSGADANPVWNESPPTISEIGNSAPQTDRKFARTK